MAVSNFCFVERVLHAGLFLRYHCYAVEPQSFVKTRTFPVIGQYMPESPAGDYYEQTYHTVPNIKTECPWSAQEYGGQELGDVWHGNDLRASLGHGGFRGLQPGCLDAVAGPDGKPVIQAAALAGYSGECRASLFFFFFLFEGGGGIFIFYYIIYFFSFAQ